MEGSTRLLQEMGDGFRGVLERHNAIVRQAVNSHRGHVVMNEGDGFFCVFQSAIDAVAAAIAIHRSLAAEAWEAPSPVKVRIGVHSGEATPTGSDYVGLDVHRAARIGAAGHGGQTVVSEVTARLTEHSLPQGTRLEDLGNHRLKDLAHEEHLYQLVVEGLESVLTPVRTLSTVKGNIPQSNMAFIGRHREREQVVKALQTSRLVTITGPAGVGKTSLALDVASDLFAVYPDGVWLVEVSRLGDDTLLAAGIARQLHISEAPDQDLIETLTSRLSQARALLVLDGCEHLVEAVAKLTDHLLHWTTGLRVLVTSREWLSIRGEHLVQLEPLSAPGPEARTLEEITSHDAVTLLVDRARLVQPSFELDQAGALIAAEITRRLDGIPLAIELAAARLKVLSLGQLVERLDRQFALLAGRTRDAPPHQQTLETTLDWSYDFLTDAEKALFTRLAVFSGGFTLDAVEAVCSGGPVETDHVIDLLGRLVETSLVMPTEGDTGRYRLLEPITHYARMRLAELEAIEDLHRRHAAYYAGVAEEAEDHLLGAGQTHWLARLDRERHNLRLALQWFHDHGRIEELGRLAATLLWFWIVRRDVSEAANWLSRPLEKREEMSPRAVARVVGAVGLVAMFRLEFERAEVFLEESRQLHQEMGDAFGVARLTYHLATVAWLNDDLDAAVRMAEDAERLTRDTGDRWAEGWILAVRGTIARCTGDLATAEDYLERSHRVLTSLGGTLDIGWSQLRLGALSRDKGEYHLAAERYATGGEMLQRSGDTLGMAHADAGLGALAWLSGDNERAVNLFQRVLEGFSLSEEASYNLFELKTMIQGNQTTATLIKVVAMNRERAIRREGRAGAKAALAEYLYHMGKTAHRNGELARARQALVESLRLSSEAADQAGAAIAVASLAVIDSEEGRHDESARLFGLAARLADHPVVEEWPPPDEPGYGQAWKAVRSRLGDDRLHLEETAGATMTLDQAVEMAAG